MLQCSQYRGVVVDCELCLPRAGLSNDLWRLSLATLEWTSIEVAPGGASPRGRVSHVMTSVGLDLWLHGGSTDSGDGDGCATHVVVLLLSR